MKCLWFIQLFSINLCFTWFLLVGSTFADAEENPTDQSNSPGNSEAVDEKKEADDEAPKEYLLQYKFVPNQFVHTKVNHKATMFTKYGEASQTVENESTTRKHFRVVSVDEDGSGLLEMMIDRVQMSTKSDAREKIEFDSNAGKEECPPQFEHVLATVGRPLARIRFSSTGKIVAVTEGIPDPNQKDKKAVENKKVSDEVSSHNFLVIFPEKPIRIGESWQDNFNVPVNVTLKLRKQINIRRTYQLKSVEGSLATITLKTTILSPVNNPEIDLQLIQRILAGTIVFNMEKGLLESRSLKTDKVVIGPFGPKSLVRGTSTHTEKRLLGAQVATKIPLPR